jgi:hypothetical protein
VAVEAKQFFIGVDVRATSCERDDVVDLVADAYMPVSQTFLA